MPEWIGQLIYLLPLAALIWKGALMAGELKQLRKDVDANHAKLNNLRGEYTSENNINCTQIIGVKYPSIA